MKLEKLLGKIFPLPYGKDKFYYTYKDRGEGLKQKILALFAEKEQEIEKLKAENEKMKCCPNCKRHLKDGLADPESPFCVKCTNMDNWQRK